MSATIRDDWRGYSLGGYLLIGFVIAGFGGGASFIRIDSALVAPATIAVASSREIVGHLEGGIISAVLAHEGDTVTDGQLLFRLDDTAARSNYDVLQSQLFADLALTSRLEAEWHHDAAITWSPELANLPPSYGNLKSDESRAFADRRRSLDGQLAIHAAHIAQTELEIIGMRQEEASSARQLALVRQELTGVDALLSQQLVQITRMLTLRREEARLEGVISRSATDQLRSTQAIAETRLDMVHVSDQFREDVSASLGKARQRIEETRSKLAVTRDVLMRTEVRAPIAGSIQAVRVGGVGQVIRQGEPLLELVPAHDRLRIDAQVQPNEIGDLQPGQQAEVRFPAFPSRDLPVMLGRVESVSGDRLLDDATHRPYYLALISVDPAELAPTISARLRPGMPAEVVVPQGERTMMSFLVDPLVMALRHTFVER